MRQSSCILKQDERENIYIYIYIYIYTCVCILGTVESYVCVRRNVLNKIRSLEVLERKSGVTAYGA